MSKSVQELSFPVPWGIIAAKAWGDPCLSPVLMLHGIQDNAGTFDRIMPHLPKCFYYVAVDLPGHGQSSRLPKGFRLHFMDYVLSVNRVVRQLKWPKFCLIGHSLGGQLGQYYAAMYPEQVTKLIVLDAYGPSNTPMEHYLDQLKETHEQVINLETKLLDGEPPSYTYEDALERMIQNRRSFITREAAEALMPRNIKQGKKGFYFSPDQRLKLHVALPLTATQHQYNHGRIRCPHLLVITKDLSNFVGIGDPKVEPQTSIGVFKKNPLFKIVEVEGAHDVHSISPEVVAPHVSKFLLHTPSHL